MTIKACQVYMSFIDGDGNLTYGPCNNPLPCVDHPEDEADEAGLDEDISRVEAAFEKLGKMLRIDGPEGGS